MKRKLVAAAAIGAAVLTMGATAFAKDYTTSDGVVTLTLPDDSWVEISDPNTWVTLGNGSDTITLLHYANGESLPNMVTADATYLMKYQAVLSDTSEVIMVTGSVQNTADYDAVVKAVQSAAVKKGGDGSAAASTSQTASSEDVYTVEDADATEYVIATAGLNVRPTYSAADGVNILGSLPYGTAVEVTGIVKCNGEDFGWRRINYNGTSAYVSRALLDTEEPAALEEDSSSDSSNTSSTIWQEPSAENNHNGNNDYDEPSAENNHNGNNDYNEEDEEPSAANNHNGNNDYDGSDDTSTDQIALTDANGTTVYIHQNDDGTYTDNQAIEYEAEGAGQWSDEYGNTYSANE